MATNTTTKRPAKAGARKSTTAAATPSTPARPRTRRISTDLPKGNASEQVENLLAKANNALAKAEEAAALNNAEQASVYLGIAANYNGLASTAHYAGH